ncbi:MAG: S41 family peptidase [Clostridiales bacterium]|nr:S41 family peptidase [Clostridiales bacterium]
MKDCGRGSSFRKGLACGIGVCALVLGLTGCAAAWFYPQLGLTEDTEEQQMDAKIQELNQYIDQYYLFDYEEEDVENGIYKGLMAGLGDIYTGYYTPEEYASFMETSNGTYSGVGAVLSQDYTTGIITVVRAFPGSPAEAAGLQTDDILYKVEGEEVTGKDLTLVVTDLKGEEGTSVNISVLRGTDVLDLSIERKHIEVPTVESRMETADIGYISISAFEDVTDEQFFAALDELESQGMKKLIIDLRNNGGGLVDVTCAILDRLLPEGLIVYTEDKNGERQEEKSDAEHYFAGDMAVLVNGNSASASEIFAGAIKDYGTGTLIGTQTFGKGIVQSLFPLSDGSAVKITVSRYYTPAGNNIHEVGITPDIILEYDREAEGDNQLARAIEVLNK